MLECLPDAASVTSAFPDVRVPIYLDNQSSTPVDPVVIDAMTPYLTGKFGNPHAASHRFGWEADAAIEQARERVAGLIGAEPGEIIFTSGATESCNFAVKGALAYTPPHRRTLIVSAIEHKCVTETAKFMERVGFRVLYAPVGADGVVDMAALENMLDDSVAMVSIMAANNEIGTIQPVEEIGALCRRHGVLFHCDAAQAAAKIPLDVRESQIDLMSLSAHKMYGPKGVGALYVRRKPRIRLEPLLHGGAQEKGVRSGTAPTMLIVGFGKAAELGQKALKDGEDERIRLMARRFREEIFRLLPGSVLNASEAARLPGNVNISLPNVDAGAVISAMREVAASAGSACASSSTEASYVLKAIGLPKERIRGSLRFSLGRFTTENEAQCAARLVAHYARKIAEHDVSV